VHDDRLDDDLPALLRRLEEHWSADAALVDRLRPGRERDEVVRALADAGIADCPPSLVDWFAWHDGRSSDDVYGSSAAATRWDLIPLESAVARFRSLLADAREYAELDGVEPVERGWSPDWFPLLINGSGDTLAVDCTPQRRPGPLQMVFSSSEVIPDVAPSVADLVRVWCSLHESGVYAVVDGAWWVDWDSEELAQHRWIA
jgi:cell wall assembly regulator SMI1